MSRFLPILLLISVAFTSCQRIDEDILPLVGIYRAHIIGVAGPFDLIIGTDRGDDVIIEAPFDGSDWYTVVADIDNQDKSIMDINIHNQDISSGVKMKGNGFFQNGTLEIKYNITVSGVKTQYTIVGTKY